MSKEPDSSCVVSLSVPSDATDPCWVYQAHQKLITDWQKILCDQNFAYFVDLGDKVAQRLLAIVHNSWEARMYRSQATNCGPLKKRPAAEKKIFGNCLKPRNAHMV